MQDLKIISYFIIGRDGRIRTDDHLTPSEVRYQAALHPVNFIDHLFCIPVDFCNHAL